jgi:2-oxoglutarate dehydrogenase E2 component (dihydrolipoamide succinyltransferase)
MPEMGEGVIEGTVARWLKEEGEPVEEFEPILEIETDKVTTEATAEVAGTVLQIYVEEGETVPVGTLLDAATAAGSALKRPARRKCGLRNAQKSSQGTVPGSGTATCPSPIGPALW